MANAEKISIALPPEIAGLLRDAVKTGEYASTGEVVRDALRAWKAKREVHAAQLRALRRMVREGMESGPGIDGEVVFSRLRRKYASISPAKPD